MFKNAKYITKFNIRWGFNNVRIKEGDKLKAAFKSNQGLYEPTVMFFELTNSPPTFQAFMNNVLQEEILKCKVAIYMDNGYILSQDLETH